MGDSLAERSANGESNAVRDQAGRGGIVAVGRLLTLSSIAATACAATARFLWIGDLAVHFRLQYVALGLLGSALFLVKRRFAWAAAALAVAALNAVIAAPVLTAVPVAAGTSATGPVHVRVASINVYFLSHAYAQVAGYIRRAHPDAVVLVEMTPPWRRALATLDESYPYRYQTQAAGGRGVTLLSRWPIRSAASLPIEPRHEPSLQATIEVSGQPLRIFAVHASWPITPVAAARRNRQLQQIAALARATTEPLLVIGDFNISPFSPHFRQLLREGHLRAAAAGYGWLPTWPVFMPLAGIQIDHALVSPDLLVRHFARGPTDGSDHWPIQVDLALPAAVKQP
jgi:endonuclease/exonuclease/phosphatase (EEP) superfamily protein YafD